MTSRERLLRDVVRKGALALLATLGGIETLTNKTLDGSSNVAVRIAELSGAGASFDFQSIPQTFRHLQLVVYGRSDTAATQTNLRMRLQDVTTATYYDQRIYAAGAAISADEALAQTSARAGIIPGATTAAVLMGTATITIPHYTQGSKEKPFISLCSTPVALTTGSVQAQQYVGFLDSSTNIDRITLFPLAGSFVADSIATLYGLPD